MIDDLQFQKLGKPDFVYAFHNVPKFEFGHVLLRRDLFAMGSVGFIVNFRGSTTHSSYPENGVSPSLAISKLIAEVNQFSNTNRSDFDNPILSTVSYAQLGEAEHGPNFGTAPGKAQVMGILRAQSNNDLKKLKKLFLSRAQALATDSALKLEHSWHESFAATECNNQCVSTIEEVAKNLGLTIKHLDEPFRWSEDFGYFTQEFKGAFFGLGSGADQPQLHDDKYDYPDNLIEVGTKVYRGLIDHHTNSIK